MTATKAESMQSIDQNYGKVKQNDKNIAPKTKLLQNNWYKLKLYYDNYCYLVIFGYVTSGNYLLLIPFRDGTFTEQSVPTAKNSHQENNKTKILKKSGITWKIIVKFKGSDTFGK